MGEPERAGAEVAESQSILSGGDLAAGWNVIVPILGLEFHAAGPHDRTVESDCAPGVDCLCPGVGLDGLGVRGKRGLRNGVRRKQG